MKKAIVFFMLFLLSMMVFADASPSTEVKLEVDTSELAATNVAFLDQSTEIQSLSEAKVAINASEISFDTLGEYENVTQQEKTFLLVWYNYSVSKLSVEINVSHMQNGGNSLEWSIMPTIGEKKAGTANSAQFSNAISSTENTGTYSSVVDVAASSNGMVQSFGNVLLKGTVNFDGAKTGTYISTITTKVSTI